MKNQLFQLQPAEEKERKLSNVIRARTNDALSCEELQLLLSNASAMFQYSVVVHTHSDAFCAALMLTHSRDCTEDGRILFGEATFGSSREGEAFAGTLSNKQNAAAVIIKRKTKGEALPHSTIHIYVPPHRRKERTVSHGKREKTASGL